MIYLFSGDDVKKKLVSYDKFIKSASKNAETFFIGANDFNSAQIESLYSGAGLFFAKSRVILTNISDNAEAFDFVRANLSRIKASENEFIFLEGKLAKPILDLFKNSGAELNIFELPKAKAEKFNSWLLPNAFMSKDKLNLWIYFRLAIHKGIAMDELTGMLFWKVKDAILKKNFGKFSEDELKNFASRLSYLLPEARKKGSDGEAAFEQFLLETF